MESQDTRQAWRHLHSLAASSRARPDGGAVSYAPDQLRAVYLVGFRLPRAGILGLECRKAGESLAGEINGK
jgi:hypothetical protein